MNSAAGEVTALVRLLGSGQQDITARLFELIYAELRRLAAARMRAERADHTLTPTALVHEAFLRLGATASLQVKDRAHFYAVVAQAMRRVLTDHARARQAAKRDGSGSEEIFPTIQIPDVSDDKLVALDEALSVLANVSPRQAKVVELRYFVGLTEEQIASVLEVTRRTISRDWQIARAWLHSRLGEA